MKSVTFWKWQEDAFERPPETLIGEARELIRGAYKLENRLLLVLDMNKGRRPFLARRRKKQTPGRAKMVGHYDAT